MIQKKTAKTDALGLPLPGDGQHTSGYTAVAHIGDGAVVDRQFGTTDVLIIMPVSELNSRYVNYYGADASRYAA